MDPDAILQRIRELYTNGSTYDDWHELAAKIRELDEWLSTNGPFPHDWMPF